MLTKKQKKNNAYKISYNYVITINSKMDFKTLMSNRYPIDI